MAHTMIQDARVLQPDFVPQEVEHRDPEVNQLSNALNPITRGEPAETTLLFGPSGTGKTCIAQFTIERLRETVLDINHQYVNCWEDYSQFKTLYRILDGIGRTLDIHRQSTPTDELLERLREYDGPPYVIILDEVDQLEERGVLYDLYRVPGLSMILIANREADLFARLDERLVSRLHSATRISFDKYSVDELVAIMKARVEWGLRTDVIDRRQLEYIADAAGGDARIAIQILRSAARTADREDHERITTDLIEEAIPEARQRVRQKDIEKIQAHQRALYDIIAEHGEIGAGELHDVYEERVDEPRSRRMRRNYLDKMEHYNLIVSEGDNRWRSYRLYEP